MCRRLNNYGGVATCCCRFMAAAGLFVSSIHAGQCSISNAMLDRGNSRSRLLLLPHYRPWKIKLMLLFQWRGSSVGHRPSITYRGNSRTIQSFLNFLHVSTSFVVDLKQPSTLRRPRRCDDYLITHPFPPGIYAVPIMLHFPTLARGKY